MSDETVRGKLAGKGEEALGRLAQDLLENPLVNGALTAALDARERAAAAQEVAMGVLNLPSASDVERLTRRVRSVGQRLEGIEDSLDRIGNLDARLTAIDAKLDELIALQKKAPAPRKRPAPKITD